MKTRDTAALLLAILVTAACAEVPPPAPASPQGPQPAVAPASSTPSPVASTTTAPVASSLAPATPLTAPRAAPIDPARVASLTGGKPESTDTTVKVSFPRDDLPVEVDGWKKMAPFMGLTSWAAFIPGGKPGVEAMVMGDLVLFEDEVGPTMSAALEGGLEVTALHNHFLFDKPRVLFMHIGGEGSVEQLAKGVKAALDAQRAVRKKAPQPASTFGAPPPSPSKIDGAKLDDLLGVKGAAKDGMYKAVFGRKTQAECGCTVGKTMGVSTWAAFGGVDSDAVVDGDFAVAETELQPVLKALRGGGINVVAIHSHMTGESPRILFLHYWGRGPAASLATTLKHALDLTAWDGKSTQT